MSDDHAALRGADRLHSRYAGDPDMAAIITMFVDELPQRIAELRACWEQRQLDQLARLAHQLKGAASGYGFPPLCDAAGRVESTLRSLLEQGSPEAMSRLQPEFDALLAVCRRASVR